MLHNEEEFHSARSRKKQMALHHVSPGIYLVYSIFLCSYGGDGHCISEVQYLQGFNA